MKLYRIAKTNFINDLTGEGARLNGGRWNHPGVRMLYCSTSLSLCLLEMLVHMDIRQVPNSFRSLEAELPDNLIKKLIDHEQLKSNWRANPPREFTKDIGSAWIQNQQSVAALAPSAVLPTELNVLVNPEHPEFDFFKINNIDVLDIDPRIY